MNQLLKNIDKIIEAPNGIEKLRQTVLQLAVQGKLVEQDPNGESVSVTIAWLKKKAIDAKTIIEPYKLPLKWSWVKLIDIGNWALGTGFPLKYQGITDEDLLFSKVSDMNLPGNEKYIFNTIHKINLETAKKIRAKIHPKGTVIFPKIGGAIATNKRRILTKATIIDNNCLGIIPNKLTSTEWLFLLLSSFDFSRYQSGTSVPALSQKTLENIVIGLPSISEQHRIVGKVNESIKLIDELEKKKQSRDRKRISLNNSLIDKLLRSKSEKELKENWENLSLNFNKIYSVAENVEKLKQAILQLAVQGKLVEQNPNDEPASELLKRIKEEKEKLIAEGKIKRQKELPPIKDGEKPFELPKGWEWVRLDELGETQTGATPPTKDSSNFGNFIPFIGPGDILNYKINYNNNGLSKIGLNKGRLIRNNSIMMVCIGGSIGKAAINSVDITCNQQINTITPFNGISLMYLFYFLIAPFFQSEVINKSSGSATPIINKQKWSQIIIAIPPTPEQNRIVEKVNELMNLCNKLGQNLELQKQEEERFVNAVISKVI